jgi:hypothetical protein
MVLALPNMFTAGTGHSIGGPSFGQLPFADRARFGHYVRHDLGSQLGCDWCIGPGLLISHCESPSLDVAGTKGKRDHAPGKKLRCGTAGAPGVNVILFLH